MSKQMWQGYRSRRGRSRGHSPITITERPVGNREKNLNIVLWAQLNFILTLNGTRSRTTNLKQSISEPHVEQKLLKKVSRMAYFQTTVISDANIRIGKIRKEPRVRQPFSSGSAQSRGIYFFFYFVAPSRCTMYVNDKLIITPFVSDIEEQDIFVLSVLDWNQLAAEANAGNRFNCQRVLMSF